MEKHRAEKMGWGTLGEGFHFELGSQGGPCQEAYTVEVRYCAM